MDKKVIRKKLRSFAIAENTFTQITGLCEHFEKFLGDIEHPLTQALVQAIAIMYRKPFSQGNGVSELPRSFEKFERREFEQLHKALIKLANESVAHTDMQNRPLPVRFLCSIDGRNRLTQSFQVDAPTFSREHFSFTRQLSQFQTGRCIEELRKLRPLIISDDDIDAQLRVTQQPVAVFAI